MAPDLAALDAGEGRRLVVGQRILSAFATTISVVIYLGLCRLVR
jgi:hypothetical protein